MESTTRRRTNRKDYKYSQVSAHDIDDEAVPHSLRRTSRAAKIGGEISNYVHSIFWIALGLFVVKYSDLIRVIRLDDRVHLPVLYISAACWCGVLSIVFYLAFWLPCVRKQRMDDFNISHPQVLYPIHHIVHY